MVRSVLVSALTLDLGHRVWWPSALDAPASRPGPPSPPPGQDGATRVGR